MYCTVHCDNIELSASRPIYMYCTVHYDNIELNASYKKKCFRQSFGENKNTRFLSNTFSPKIMTLVR